MTVDQLLEKWLGKEGGAERANYQMFLTELASALDLPAPDPKGAGLGDFQFEAPVRSEAVYGGKGTKRIDLYKRGHFILEAKQSQVAEGEALPEDPRRPRRKRCSTCSAMRLGQRLAGASRNGATTA